MERLPNKMNTFAYDFETYYSKTYTIKTLGNWLYTHHEEFDAYLLSVAGDNGFRWVGHPKDFDWEVLRGQRVLAHNAPFEFAVTERLKELGIVPKDLEFGELLDTADLAAFLGVPRSLAEACKQLLGITVDKSIRDRAKGKHWKDMTPEFQKEMTTYGLQDSVLELQLFMEKGHLWPQWERELSIATREMCWEGLPVDKKAAEEAIASLKAQLSRARHLIPWAEDPETPALSPIRAAEECRKNGITPPKSMAKDSDEFQEWLDLHGEKFPWAKAMGDYRSINILLKKLETLVARTDDNNIFRYGLKYFGAHTGRDSGDSGFNPQNPPREALYGVDLRRIMITAPEGYILGVADLSAIEPCVLNMLAGDEEFCSLLRQGMDPYEVQARVNHGYKDPQPMKKVDPDGRQYMKVEVLACGYGAGPEKVQWIAKHMVGIDISLHKADQIVQAFRKRKFIPKLWRELEKGLRDSIKDGTFEMELMTGRVMRYRNVQGLGTALQAAVPRMGKMMKLKWWGGSLTENIVQANAREVFMWNVLKLKKAGIKVLLRAHDEVVMLFKKENAEAEFARAMEIFASSPEWWTGLPVRAEGHLTPYYKKP